MSNATEAQGDRALSKSAWWLRMAALGLGWILLWRVSALMEYAPHASIWFPPAGLTLAALLVLGRSVVPVLVVSCIVVSLWAGRIYTMEETAWELLPSAILFAVSHIGAYGLGAWVLIRLVLRSREISVPSQIIAFLITGSLSALLAALFGVQALIFGGMIGAEESAGLWLPWWIGDMAATIALAPLFIGLLEQVFPRPKRWFVLLALPSPSISRQSWILKTSVLLSLLVAVMVLTAAVSERGELLAFSVFFLIIPQMWITYTEGALRVATSLAAFSTLIAICVGVFGLMEQAMVYQFAITVIAASTYFGLSVPVLMEQNRQLRQLADVDELTGVINRRYFFERAHRELADARRSGEPATLVIFDIDRFKQINDDLGHLVGDAVLVEAADRVGHHMRRGDLFGRFGGDEFMLLMSGCDAQQAAERCEQLRRTFHDISFNDHAETFSATFSVVEIGPTESVTQAFDRADAALLAAKRAGRDRVAGPTTEGAT
ncbi:sensor domain-containing diguanylate cyclase [Wenzhouxiangella sp. XN201]|uniref:sensor domain-containing diguanylate cyclase n=1 Tax=Wenzhouxiangella sp. XN201 TaxID=2710755 RepID=UPI0013CCDB3C|nr:diguanylate cyclase [Wenzhouxiangella sp. XN201]NEZ04312.1 sensor domain-containing diguanylate cyclase [Wenzhouxiangella sp. XN201]